VVRSTWILALVVAVVGLACWPGPEVGPLIAGQSGGLDANAPLSEIQARYFTPDCATALCHQGTPSPHTPLSLEDGLSYGTMVNRPAAQAPSMLLVKPGSPEASYLMLKLLGTVGSTGSVATRMPPGKGSEADRIEAVRAWILRGAPND